MSRYPEISSLFAAIASNLRHQNPPPRDDADVSIANLSRSLNLTELPRLRILDAALSLMCFTAPQAYDTVIDFTLRTTITVLSSSIGCKLLKNNKEQVLRVGGLISKSHCVKIMKECADILVKMDGHEGDLCYSLLYSIFRVAAFAPCSPCAKQSMSNEMNLDDSITFADANLFSHLPKTFTYKNGEMPLRLLLWHLDPIILKEDVSKILREKVKRPFLSIRMEIYDRIDWRSKIICLVISPTMFLETRALLHSWFLITGLASIMELQTEIVGQVLDIISRPMWWGLSMEVGSKLPFSLAYFPYDHLLRILAGPISLEYFKQLLQKICGSGSHIGGHLQASSLKTATNINVVHHKSMWAMVMNFPGWFFFACMMLFSNNGPADNVYSVSVPGSLKSCAIHDHEETCPALAAKFISWILNPITDSNQNLALDYLVKVSELWTLRYSSLNKCNELTRSHKQTRRANLNNEDEIISPELDSRSVSLWLKEIKELHVKHFGAKSGFSASNAKGFGIHQNTFLRKIPLGILLSCLNHLNGAACSLLLHYAATGIILEFSSSHNSGQFGKRWKRDSRGDLQTWIEQCTKAEAVAGCRAVFDITDIAESTSDSLFESEEGLNFVCQVKLKTCEYLLKCMKRLLQVKLDGDGAQMQRDLLARVLRWRCQGKDVFQDHKDLNCVCEALNV